MKQLAILTLFAPWLATPVIADDPAWVVRGKGGMVAADSRYASRIGADVLASGGNAFDAAVATSLALGVTRPYSTGLGGGGFMVAYVAKDKRFVVLDFRESAPSGATTARFAALKKRNPDGPPPSLFGGNAVGTPGLPAGCVEIAKRFGTRPLAELAAPVIELAERGFAVDASYRGACESILDTYSRWPELKRRHAWLFEHILGNGTPPRLGAVVKRPQLAAALRLFAERGREAFYGGPIGEAAVRAVQAAGGALTLDDLKSYRVREREPIRATYRGYQIVSMPPPSSGGVCLAETLNILEQFDFSGPAAFDPSRSHLLIEAMKHSFADRARWLGDADFADVPVARLIDKGYARRLADRIRRTIAGSDDGYGSRQLGNASPAQPPPDDGGTSHFCVADRFGNVVAMTETINATFGSLVVAEPFGIILNNQIDDFVTAAGQPNLYGLIQSDANLVAPGKRPLSSMSPTIVMKDGKPVLTLGASGGPLIISSVLQVMLNVIEFDRPLMNAVWNTRLHHQWKPDEVFFDRTPPSDLASGLRGLGHTVSDRRRSAVVQAIQFLDDGTMIGVSDPRKGGRPAAVDR